MATQEELNSSAHSWLLEFHGSNDQLRPRETVPKFFREDCVMEFPGQPVRRGRASIVDFFETQFAHLESMKHTINIVDATSEKIWQEATISYVVKDDPEKKAIVIQGVAVFVKGADEDKMSYFRVYLDPTPLAQRIKEVFS